MLPRPQNSIPQSKETLSNVTRATLKNGMRVVIIRNPLAPVVTVEENYLVGGDETPDGFPGMAHAQEHMALRGCTGLSGDQTAALYAQLGGLNNADTQQNITQYFATVPAADLDIALRMDAACMQKIDASDDQWGQERGAIEQEVARDLSYYALDLGNHVLGGGFYATRFYHDLRQVTGYVYTVDVSLSATVARATLFGHLCLRPQEHLEGPRTHRPRSHGHADEPSDTGRVGAS
jgi:predicted Zn-dependent peptidase